MAYVITVNSCKGVSDIFNSFFKSIYVIDDSRNILPLVIPNLSGNSLSSITINECDVLLAALKTIDVTTAFGTDDIYLVGYRVSVLKRLPSRLLSCLVYLLKLAYFLLA